MSLRKGCASPVEKAPKSCGRWGWVLVAVLFAILAAELALGVASDGLTIDEVVYIGAGYRHLTAGDFRLNPEQPPVAKLLGAVGLLGLDAPPFDISEGEWGWGYALVNADHRTIPRARIASCVMTLLLAALLWGWSRSVYGASAGIAALVLTVFHPSLLAHGHLLTTDLPGALTMVAGSWAFWRWSLSPNPARAALVGLALGLAGATRITGWLLLPAFALLLVLRRKREHAAKDAMILGVIALSAAPLVIWAAYGFRFAPYPGVLVAPGLPKLLPAAYIEGVLDVVRHNAAGHPTYLLGAVSERGWPYYYAVAFLVKNTPGFLLGVAWAAGRLFRRGLKELEAHWLVPAAAMFLVASVGHIQIGERYLLPVYPYLILLVSSCVPGLLTGGRVVLGLLALLHILPALWVAPRGYLVYFNSLAGGPDRAYRVLVDSNLDWGQDLPRLARWMKKNGVQKVQLGYHGSDNPERFGIAHDDLPGLHLYPDHPPERPFEGTLAVSPNLLVGVFYPPGLSPYARLLARSPDDRAGVFLIYRLP
jgi:4-amino-4-deoxy-L-arabinose transferase-like glycosyltransferase